MEGYLTGFLDDLQRMIGTWANTALPEPHLVSAAAHKARDEAHELVAAAANGFIHDIAEETADVAIALLTIAHRAGFSLKDAIRKKHAVNLTRRWGPPDPLTGVTSHVREGA